MDLSAYPALKMTLLEDCCEREDTQLVEGKGEKERAKQEG